MSKLGTSPCRRLRRKHPLTAPAQIARARPRHLTHRSQTIIRTAPKPLSVIAVNCRVVLINRRIAGQECAADSGQMPPGPDAFGNAHACSSVVSVPEETG